MTSMRRLRRRLVRWRRYAVASGWKPDWVSAVRYRAPRGWDRAYEAWAREWTRRNQHLVHELRRECLFDGCLGDDEARRIREHAHACWDGCDDLHTCADCGEQEDVCGGDCGEAYSDLGDDAGYGDTWQPMPVETVTAFQEAGLL